MKGSLVTPKTCNRGGNNAQGQAAEQCREGVQLESVSYVFLGLSGWYCDA